MHYKLDSYNLLTIEWVMITVIGFYFNFFILILLIDLFEENIELSMELVQHMEDYLQAEIQVNIFMFEL